MKKKTLTPFQRVAVFGTATFVLTAPFVQPVRAQFGGIVFDPSVFGKLVAEYTQQIQQYVRQGLQLQQEIQQVKNSFLQLENEAKQAVHFVEQKQNWINIELAAAHDSTQNQYGETVNWSTMVNGYPQIAPAVWSEATTAPTHLTYLANEVPGASRPLAQLASVEAQDGSASKCLATIAQYRADSAANANAVLDLESAQADGTDQTNSEIEQLNLINAAQAQANAESRSQGAIQACLVEQQILAAKAQRDTLADHLTFVGKAHDYTLVEQNDWTGAMNSLADYPTP
jgi:type IV secretion system protein TrbJ